MFLCQALEKHSCLMIGPLCNSYTLYNKHYTMYITPYTLYNINVYTLIIIIERLAILLGAASCVISAVILTFEFSTQLID